MARFRYCKHTGAFVPVDIAAEYTRPRKSKSMIINRDALVEGYRSPYDGHVFKNRRDYENYLKKNNFVCTGDINVTEVVRKREEKIAEMRNAGHSFFGDAKWIDK